MKLFLLLIFLQACAQLGEKFQVELPQGPEAVVYLYRPVKFAGSNGNPEVMLDGKAVGNIPHGAYTRLTLSPGPHHLDLKGTGYTVKGFDFKASAGALYYARVDLSRDVGERRNKYLSEDDEIGLLNALDRRAQSDLSNPGFFLLRPELAEKEITQTKSQIIRR